MLELKVIKDNQEIRNIQVENNNFLLVQNGITGPVYDTENFGYLRIDDKRVISQRYLDIIKGLYRKFDRYLYALWPEQICCMVDQDWQPSEKTNRNSRWKIEVVKANSLFTGVTGYEYIIKMRQHWINEWSEAQLHAAIMSQLLRIDNERGSIIKYSEDFQSRLVATFGAGYLEPGTVIDDLLDDKTPAVLRGFREASGQVTMEEVIAENGESEVKYNGKM